MRNDLDDGPFRRLYSARKLTLRYTVQQSREPVDRLGLSADWIFSLAEYADFLRYSILSAKVSLPRSDDSLG